ncbi:hypothetical protein V8E51_004059 [Hyaloscypha variabilis]
MEGHLALADPSSSSQISYQTAFWTLVPLAIITMMHSPILCSLDALFFLLRLVFSPLVLRIPLSQVIEITIQERYRDVEDLVEGIQYLEKQTWLRWLWFVLGTLGPAIKLATMQNVPWTKAWGMMFLGAFVVFESMVFLKKRNKRRGFELLTHEEPASIPAPVPGRMNVHIDDINDFELKVFILAVLMHFGIVLWAIWDLWAIQTLASQTAEEAGVLDVLRTPRSIRLMQLLGLFYNWLIPVTALGILIYFILFCDSIGTKPEKTAYIIQLVIGFLALGCFLGPILYDIISSDTKVHFRLPSFAPLCFLDISLFFGTFIALLFLEWVIRWICSR